MINIERLKEIMHYDFETGIFTWKLALSKRIHVGDIAGNDNGEGYLRMQIDKKTYQAHRLAWFYHYEKWPDDQIDHINNIRNDNRISNLREATHLQNQWNQSLTIRNTSGYKGVSFNTKLQKWKAGCRVSGKTKHIGYFDSPEEADIAVRKFRESHHKEYTNHGI